METAPPDDPLLQDLAPAQVPGLSADQLARIRAMQRGAIIRMLDDNGAAMAGASPRRRRYWRGRQYRSED